jgi:hypothetical protein
MYSGIDAALRKVSSQVIALLGRNANRVEKRANIVESGGGEANQIVGFQPLGRGLTVTLTVGADSVELGDLRRAECSVDVR